MTKEEFLEILEEALELASGSLHEEMSFADMREWDSMSALIFMAVADEQLGAAVTGDQIAGCKTVGDLLALLSGKFVS